jgi:hypothetical protein
MYRQLNLPQRQLIEQLHARKCSMAAIARAVGVHRCTIKKELERNSEAGHYNAQKAQQKASDRKSIAGKIANQDIPIRFHLNPRKNTVRSNPVRLSFKRLRKMKPLILPRDLRLQTDWEDLRIERKRKYKRRRFKFKKFLLRQFYLRMRERDHFREGLERTPRSYFLDFRHYKRQFPIFKKPLIKKKIRRVFQYSPSLCLDNLGGEQKREKAFLRLKSIRTKNKHRDGFLIKETLKCSQAYCQYIQPSYNELIEVQYNYDRSNGELYPETTKALRRLRKTFFKSA